MLWHKNLSSRRIKEGPFFMKKTIIISVSVFVALIAAGAIWYFFFMKKWNDTIVLPYISHQKPHIDPHLPSSVPISDKLDEVLFDGLFNVSSNASGITYEDGLGEFMGIDENDVVTIRLKPTKKWHSSYDVSIKKGKVNLIDKNAVQFVAQDLNFTMRRIAHLGSLSPDYILISQAIVGLSFIGPDNNGEIKFQFKGDREWKEADIKEVLSFKILPNTSDLEATQYNDGTGPYILAGEDEEKIYFTKNPIATANISKVLLKPFIDNSTYSTELKNGAINSLLDVPFGSMSPILSDTLKYFSKPSISTCFFVLLCNTERLTKGQRQSLRKLVDNQNMMYRFFKANTPQQRHILDYKGNLDNYEAYLNWSIFPTSSYYVEEKVVTPLKDYSMYQGEPLPDTVRIQTCLNFGFREELAELVQIFNEPNMFGGKIKATAVQNEELRKGNYDAVLVPVAGYRSNFLFDLYDIFLREPDFSMHRINLVTKPGNDNVPLIDESSFQADKNFLRLDLENASADKEQIKKLLDLVYGFMSTNELGDKQMYAQLIDELDQDMALGCYLFSLPSLAYFSTQFDPQSINLYGVSSQLSTIEYWKEKLKRK